jgi:hypothetical protein
MAPMPMGLSASVKEPAAFFHRLTKVLYDEGEFAFVASSTIAIVSSKLLLSPFLSRIGRIRFLFFFRLNCFGLATACAHPLAW